MEVSVNVSNYLFGGRLKNFLPFWNKLTTDGFILQCIKGVKIDFNSDIIQTNLPNQICCAEDEKSKIDAEITKFIECGIIEKVEHTQGEYISHIFSRPKKSGELRIILNLKPLNEDVRYEHFKMENLETALGLIEQNYFMASIDLEHAYYLVNVNDNFRKYLRFVWNNVLFQYTCLPNGLSSAPRIFTKIMKPIFAKLRSEGHLSVIYLDDSLLIGANMKDCLDNIQATSDILQAAGFILNRVKSVFSPSQKIKFLGFWIDSSSMTVFLPVEKKECIFQMCSEILKGVYFTIRFVAQFIGILVSSLPAVQHGALFYRFLEKDKIEALACSKGNFEAYMQLSAESIDEVKWWLMHIDDSLRYIKTPPPDLKINCDASTKGWGGVHNGESTGGQWSFDENLLHINVLELKAILLGLQSFFKECKSVHIRIETDNTTALAYINKLGGVQSMQCHRVAKDIWIWAIEKNIHLSAVHLPGSENVLADKASRVFDENTEWTLCNSIFENLSDRYGPFDIDLFASRLNAKITTYCSWKPDPGAQFIDALQAIWAQFNNFYAFPPFSVIMKCLRKVGIDRARGMIIVPYWPTQSWFPKLMAMCVKPTVLLPKNVIHLPFKDQVLHKQHKSLQLIACPISGNVLEAEGFRKSLLTLCLLPGEDPPLFNMKYILENGYISVVKRRLIPCIIMKEW